MPVGAQFLHVAEQSGERDGPERTLLLWALVDKDAPREQHLIQISGTGHPIEEPGSHIGSVTDHGLVWHVFDGDVAWAHDHEE